VKNLPALSAALILLAATAATAQVSEEKRAAGVPERGDHVMGFDHAKTTHHFRLTPSGGRIEAEANDPADTESRDQIRTHFTHIAKMFSEGDFEAPMLIHEKVPPGVPVLKESLSRVRYDFEPTERGGHIVISTKNARALAAIHEFLRFQIDDHKTGDSKKIVPEKSTSP
jgi:hypothetical protein